jgi:hypothetical protein
MLWDIPYIVEILTPRRKGEEPLPADAERFERRYRRAVSSKFGVSIPDNPLGNPRFSAVETFGSLGLQPDPERTLLNLNTFHAKGELHELLDRAEGLGIRYVLVIRGDGGPLLSKLTPDDLGMGVKMVTSIELLRYINERYGDRFCTGAAFNQYKPEPVEHRKLEKKRDAGAKFIITQPVLGDDARIGDLIRGPLPVIIEAWMSEKIDLFLRSIKAEPQNALEGFDPVQNLADLHRAFPDSSVYLSLLDFSADWKTTLPKAGS